MIPFDSTGAFCPSTGGGELRRLAVRGAATTISASLVAGSAQVVSTVILARLLTPADFGVVAMVTTFSFILVSVGVTGFTEAVLQLEEMDRYTASNLFWVNSGAGLVLAIAFAAAGSVLARFYRNPLVENVTIGLSLSIFIGGTSVIHLALLKRAMHFSVTASNDVAGRVANTAVAVLLALRGWGYWALVAGMVAQQVSLTIGAWWLCRWIPSPPRRTGKTAATIRFAAKVYAQFGLRYSTQNLDNLLVGWRFNAVALGFYKRAYDLFALTASQLTGPLCDVALASLSRLNQDAARFRRYLVTSLGIIGFVGMAVSADLTLVGKDMVRLVLGPRWSESGRIFQLLGPGIGAMLLCSTVGWIHMSIGKPGRWLRWTFLGILRDCGFRFLLALALGAKGDCGGNGACPIGSFLAPAFWYAGRPIGFVVSSLIAAVGRYAAAALLAGFATAAIFRGMPVSAPPVGSAAALQNVIIVSAAFIALYLGAVILLHWGCAPLRQVAGLLRDLAPTRRATNAVAEPVGECK